MEKEKVEKIKDSYLEIDNFKSNSSYYRLETLLDSLIKEFINIQDSETEIKSQSEATIQQLNAISIRELEFVKLAYNKCTKKNAARARFKELEKEIDNFKMKIYLSRPLFISDLN
jgi:phage gp29-like protein